MSQTETHSMTDTKTPISIGFYSLGCAKNLVDSQLMAGNLLSNGLRLAPSPAEADVVIVNTCSFIQDARNESYDSIAEACALKANGQCRAVIVTGCLPQRYRDDIKNRLPDVDAFTGLDELEDITRVVQQVLGKHDTIRHISETPTRLYEPRLPELSLTGGPFAYLKIAEGCNHACAFCAIPGIRGKHRSRRIDGIVAEAESLLEAGFRELVIISQDVTAYGHDLPDDTRLPQLLRALGRIGGDFWIRLLYGYPSHLSDTILETMAEIPQICHYLDIPIQHSHPDVLRSMQRSNTITPVQNMVQRARVAMPDVTLRTTCLVGHPGETDDHFKHLLDFVQQARFDHLGSFTFSPEEGTPAATMPDRPNAETARDRREALMLAQQKIVDNKAEELIGQSAMCLLEQQHPEYDSVWIGRTERYAPEVDGCVYVEDITTGKPGDFISVHYTEQDGYDMIAVVSP